MHASEGGILANGRCDPRELIMVWWRRTVFAHAPGVGGRHVGGTGDGPLMRVCCFGRGKTETAEVPRRSQSGDDAARPVSFPPSSVSLQALQDMRNAAGLKHTHVCESRTTTEHEINSTYASKLQRLSSGGSNLTKPETLNPEPEMSG
jgi:hypothetical protein